MKGIKSILTVTLTLVLIISLFSCAIEPSTEEDNDKLYEVGTSHFTLLDPTYEPIHDAIRIAFSTDISIESHTVTITLRDKDNGAIKEQTISESFSYKRGDTISHYIKCERKEAIATAEISVKAKTHENPKNYDQKVLPRVTFYVNDSIWATALSKSGEAIFTPDMPSDDSSIFAGWYLDKDFKTPFDFSATYTSDTPVYARFIFSDNNIINKVTTEIIPSIVTIRTTYYKYQGFQRVSQNATSSGFVVNYGGKALVMTNCHSVELIDGFTSMTIVVEDYLGKQYSAEILSVGESRVISADYDLAVLSVSGMTDIPPLEFADKGVSIGDEIISLGSPAGQKNAISLGTVGSFGVVTIDIEENISNVNFPVIHHTAPIKGGSSGGCILNKELLVVGVNFAGKDGDSFTDGYSIPLDKVLEFLATYLGE